MGKCPSSCSWLLLVSLAPACLLLLSLGYLFSFGCVHFHTLIPPVLRRTYAFHAFHSLSSNHACLARAASPPPYERPPLTRNLQSHLPRDCLFNPLTSRQSPNSQNQVFAVVTLLSASRYPAMEILLPIPHACCRRWCRRYIENGGGMANPGSSIAWDNGTVVLYISAHTPK